MSMAKASDDGVARCRVNLGALDLAFLADNEESGYSAMSASAAIELAARWERGPARVLMASDDEVLRAANSRRGCRKIAIDTLAEVAGAATAGNEIPTESGALVIVRSSDLRFMNALPQVARPDSFDLSHRRSRQNPVAQLQCLAARLHGTGTTLVSGLIDCSCTHICCAL